MLFIRIGRYIAAALVDISGLEAALIILIYGIACYLGLSLLGEAEIVSNWVDFIYWLVVTASTVGYGDVSPVSPYGKLFTSLFIIPFGLSMFAMLITHFAYFFSRTLSRHHKGLAMSYEQQHCIIIGWDAVRTPRLVQLLKADKTTLNGKLVLCSVELEENPLPGDVEFIKLSNFLNEQDIERSGVSNAARILVNLSSDDATLTTSLLCQKLNPDAHKTAFLDNPDIAQLLKSHCDSIEVIQSVDTELLASATLYPGSSQIQRQLLDSTSGITQYSAIYEGQVTTFGQLFDALKKQLNATLIGYKEVGTDTPVVNADNSAQVQPQSQLYYYAAQRLDDKAVSNLELAS